MLCSHLFSLFLIIVPAIAVLPSGVTVDVRAYTLPSWGSDQDDTFLGLLGLVEGFRQLWDAAEVPGVFSVAAPTWYSSYSLTINGTQQTYDQLMSQAQRYVAINFKDSISGLIQSGQESCISASSMGVTCAFAVDCDNDVSATGVSFWDDGKQIMQQSLVSVDSYMTEAFGSMWTGMELHDVESWMQLGNSGSTSYASQTETLSGAYILTPQLTLSSANSSLLWSFLTQQQPYFQVKRLIIPVASWGQSSLSDGFIEQLVDLSSTQGYQVELYFDNSYWASPANYSQGYAYMEAAMSLLQQLATPPTTQPPPTQPPTQPPTTVAPTTTTNQFTTQPPPSSSPSASSSSSGQGSPCSQSGYWTLNCGLRSSSAPGATIPDTATLAPRGNTTTTTTVSSSASLSQYVFSNIQCLLLLSVLLWQLL